MDPMVASGMASQADLLRMQVERAAVESDLLGLRLQRPRHWCALELVAASGVELAPEVEVDTAGDPIDGDGTSGSCAAHAWPLKKTLRQVLKTAPARATVTHAALVEANWMWVPDFVVGASWMDMQARPWEKQRPGTAWSVRAGISIPWQFHVSKARADAAAANEIAARLVVEQKKLDLLAELDSALFELADAERMLKLYSPYRGRAAQSALALDLVRTDFSTGKARLADVLSAQRSRLAGELSPINARTDVLKARAMLLALTGLNPEGKPGE